MDYNITVEPNLKEQLNSLNFVIPNELTFLPDNLYNSNDLAKHYITISPCTISARIDRMLKISLFYLTLSNSIPDIYIN